jgi:hypothetical protein
MMTMNFLRTPPSRKPARPRLCPTQTKKRPQDSRRFFRHAHTHISLVFFSFLVFAQARKPVGKVLVSRFIRSFIDLHSPPVDTQDVVVVATPPSPRGCYYARGRISPFRKPSCGVISSHHSGLRVQQNPPANSGTRHSGDDSRLQASQKPPEPLALMDNLGRIHQTLTMTYPLVSGRSPGLQQRLDNVQRRGKGRSERAGEATGHAMRERIVFLARVQHLAEGVVGGELDSREGNRHRQRGRVRHVEGPQALVAVHRLRAVRDRLVGGPVHLHALLDDVERVHQRVAGGRRAGAGEAAHERVVLVADVAAQVVFDRFVGCEVDGMRGT